MVHYHTGCFFFTGTINMIQSRFLLFIFSPSPHHRATTVAPDNIITAIQGTSHNAQTHAIIKQTTQLKFHENVTIQAEEELCKSIQAFIIQHNYTMLLMVMRAVLKFANNWRRKNSQMHKNTKYNKTKYPIYVHQKSRAPPGPDFQLAALRAGF